MLSENIKKVYADAVKKGRIDSQIAKAAKGKKWIFRFNNGDPYGQRKLGDAGYLIVYLNGYITVWIKDANF